MTAPRPPGKLIGHPSDLKRSCQKRQDSFNPHQRMESVAMKKTWWFTLTGPLHVLQFDVDVALDVQRQRCLAPRDHGGVDDTHVAVFHCLPGLPQKIQCDYICSYFTHLRKKKLHILYGICLYTLDCILT